MSIEIDGEAVLGMSLRFLFLTTHYRKPIDYTHDKLMVAKKSYLKLLSKAERGEHTSPPVEFLEAVCDDMNTPKAIALLHTYAKLNQSDKLFASMLLLGLIPNSQPKGLGDLEQKTQPEPGVLPAARP